MQIIAIVGIVLFAVLALHFFRLGKAVKDGKILPPVFPLIQTANSYYALGLAALAICVTILFSGFFSPGPVDPLPPPMTSLSGISNNGERNNVYSGPGLSYYRHTVNGRDQTFIKNDKGMTAYAKDGGWVLLSYDTARGTRYGWAAIEKLTLASQKNIKGAPLTKFASNVMITNQKAGVTDMPDKTPESYFTYLAPNTKVKALAYKDNKKEWMYCSFSNDAVGKAMGFIKTAYLKPEK